MSLPEKDLKSVKEGCEAEIEKQIKENQNKIREKKQELEQVQEKLFKVEEKWINSEITRETYE